MRAVVTRVTEASVVIEGKTVGSIQKGFLVLLGVAPEDTWKLPAEIFSLFPSLRCTQI